jgi:hypothetical protein
MKDEDIQKFMRQTVKSLEMYQLNLNFVVENLARLVTEVALLKEEVRGTDRNA